jgi:integrase
MGSPTPLPIHRGRGALGRGWAERGLAAADHAQQPAIQVAFDQRLGVQERLGHATIAITLDTYSHAIPAMQEDAAAKIAALLG